MGLGLLHCVIINELVHVVYTIHAMIVDTCLNALEKFSRKKREFKESEVIRRTRLALWQHKPVSKLGKIPFVLKCCELSTRNRAGNQDVKC